MKSLIKIVTIGLILIGFFPQNCLADIVWEDFRKPFWQRVRVTVSNSKTLVVDLPSELIEDKKLVALTLKIESTVYSKSRQGLSKKTSFQPFSPIISLNNSFFGAIKIPAKDFPGIQIHEVHIPTKKLKAGSNRLKFSFEWDNPEFNYKCPNCGYVITDINFKDAKFSSYTRPPAVPEETLVKDQSGVVRDTKSGLEWFSGPDEDMGWEKARGWINNLNVAGGRWRIPTTDNVKTLYKSGIGPNNISPLLECRGLYIWSTKINDLESPWLFGLLRGKALKGQMGISGNFGRILAVRNIE